jgi:beta-glucosidase
LYPFGYGLSYTNFGFENLRLEPASVGTNGSTTMRVDVTNAGSRAGTEVVEMYIHQKHADIVQPVMALRGFKRVTLKPGEKLTVDLPLTHESLSMVGMDMKPIVEPGVFDVMVGPSSAETQTVTLTVEKPTLRAAPAMHRVAGAASKATATTAAKQ